MKRVQRIELSYGTFFRAAVVAAIVWAWLLLWAWVLIFVLAAFIAVALDPAVVWLDARGLKRRFGGPLVVLLIAGVVIGFLALSATSLATDATALSASIRGAVSRALDALPEAGRQAVSSLAPSPQALAGAGQQLLNGLAGIGVALVVTVYLLLDGRRTYRWLLAFVPARARRRADRTAQSARVIAAEYMRGNCITSLLTAVFTWIALVLMDVPAALLLSILAGLFDFLPVIGFLLSAAPAIVLAFAVSPATALGVAAFYVAYNLVENYYIQPLVYGKQMDLSSLAVIGAFLVGGVLGGVLGALIALPIAALYPSVEAIWASGDEASDTAAQHARIQRQPEH